MAEFIWGIVVGALSTLAIIFTMMAWRAFVDRRDYLNQDHQS